MNHVPTVSCVNLRSQSFVSLFWLIVMVDLKQQKNRACAYLESGKFYIRRNNNKADSIETGRIVIAHSRLLSDLEKCKYTTLF